MSWATAGFRSRPPGVVAGGNFIVDHVKCIDHWPEQDGLARVLHDSKHNGGGPYNLLKDLSRLQAPFPLTAVGLLGEDEHGRWIRADCAAHGINPRGLQTCPGEATSYTDVMSVQAGGRRTFFHRAGANARLGPEHFDFGSFSGRFFYLGYLLLLQSLDTPGPDGRPRAIQVLRRARAAGFTTVLDCVSDAGDRWQTVVAPVLPEVEILFANDYEAMRLTGVSVGPTAGVVREGCERAAAELIRRGVRQLALVHAPEGVAAASVAGECAWQGAVNVSPGGIEGTTGAGDALAAGVLLGLHEGATLREALELGVCAAATCLQHPSASDGVCAAGEALQRGRTLGYR